MPLVTAPNDRTQLTPPRYLVPTLTKALKTRIHLKQRLVKHTTKIKQPPDFTLSKRQKLQQTGGTMNRPRFEKWASRLIECENYTAGRCDDGSVESSLYYQLFP